MIKTLGRIEKRMEGKRKGTGQGAVQTRALFDLSRAVGTGAGARHRVTASHASVSHASKLAFVSIKVVSILLRSNPHPRDPRD